MRGQPIDKHRFFLTRGAEYLLQASGSNPKNAPDGWISLLHTWVPPVLRGRGIANELAQKALEFAKDNGLKVEVICPVVFSLPNKTS